MSKSIYHETKPFWKRLFEKGMEEDQVHWDWTAKSLKKADSVATAQVMAKSSGVWTGEALVAVLQEEYEGIAKIQSLLLNGAKFDAGTETMSIKGHAQAILGMERTLLNLLSHTCGVASQTRRWVDEIQKISKQRKLKKTPRLTATRKTLPGYKELELEAVTLGGGFVHRPHLAGGILIKENHIRMAGGVQEAIQQVAAKAPHGFKIEIEVASLKELKEALNSKSIHGVMLDNFSKDDLLAGLEQRRKHPRGDEVFVEVSGGLSVENLGDVIFEGVDLLSSGKLTHSVNATDLSLLFRVE